ncbi:AAA-like domain-containing protein [Calothrix sp. UHCC 0171]|uniref:AAA-like domain-containing protein n=1 Tax=Calothrix sp. UHCC 0171 TaxID=3110245 RepID=UPI002B202058|nr:AAA-like domain-containing protein [Calothrix sp. UHCC 0171]MEA5572497.1 AAA-like domain-containing protein [Calothrix sp. UHCC 0171]
MDSPLGTGEQKLIVKKCKACLLTSEKLLQTLKLYKKVKHKVIQLCTCMTESDFTWETALEFADKLIFDNTGIHLKDIEINVLQASWEGVTYPQMADNYGYSAEYLNKDVGNKLWNKLTEALGKGEKVSKHNFKEALRRSWKQHKCVINDISQTLQLSLIPRDSVYIERPPIEERCFTEIIQPGCLLRIKAPLQTGKTELMSRILHYASNQGYRTVELNLRDATAADFCSLDAFLQCLCTSITEMLQVSYPVAEHWRKSLGNSKIKCRTYFEKYLLTADKPLVLALDEVDKMFPYPEITGEFLGMLRTWHEDAKTRPLWRQLRLVVVHTQAYMQLDINQSPFNAGTEISLPDFTAKQVLLFAQKYGLDWDINQVMQLMVMVGGHPYLVGEAIKHISQENISLEEVLRTAVTGWGMYRYHLQKHCQNLLANSQLIAAFKKVVTTDISVEFDGLLNQDTAVKLNDLGLVTLSQTSARPRYELYRFYFRQRCQEND